MAHALNLCAHQLLMPASLGKRIMILQSAVDGRNDSPEFVIKQTEHGALCGQFTEHFGNASFELPEPRAEVINVIRCHDNGWLADDENPSLDPKTRLPFNVLATPRSKLFATSRKSSDYNEKLHPYCGLISSMHSWGLYNGRYGLSDKILVDFIEDEFQNEMNDMLDGELKRQDKLKLALGENPETAAWTNKARAFTNYKLLQFCDTLALYFNLTPEGARTETSFANVPMDLNMDVSVTIKPLGKNSYSLAPYPFAEDPLEVYFEGHYLAPFAPGEEPDLAEIMQSAKVERQMICFVSG